MLQVEAALVTFLQQSLNSGTTLSPYKLDKGRYVTGGWMNGVVSTVVSGVLFAHFFTVEYVPTT